MSSTQITAIILAGGKSSRMGTDKALLEVNQVPLIQKISEIAKTVAYKVYVITPWGERYQAILPPDCEILKEVPLNGETFSPGPLIGFTQGLGVVETEWVLLLACDLPRLTASALQEWALSLTDVPENVVALLPRHVKGWEPLCGFYRCSCLPSLSKYIEGGGRSFQGWLADQPVKELPVKNWQLLFNCNTVADLEAVKDNL